MIRLLKAYQNALKVHPLKTAALSAGTLMTTGDAIAQLVVEKKPFSKFELKRSLRFVVFGTFLAIFTNYMGETSASFLLHNCLHRALLSVGDLLAQFVVEKRPFEKYDPKRTLRFAIFGTFFGGPVFSLWYVRLAKTFGHTKYATLKMVACDQLLFAPPFIAYFLSMMEVLKGEGLQDIKNKLQDDYLEVLKTNYKIWPLVQTVNFNFVPVHYRVVTVNIVAVFWNTYLAWMSEKTHEHPEMSSERTLATGTSH